MYVISSTSSGSRSNTYDPCCWGNWGYPSKSFPFSGNVYVATNSSGEKTPEFVRVEVDWKESPEACVLMADLPGLKKEEVKVEVKEGRVLKISGERIREAEEENDKYHLSERSKGKFQRKFRLPEDANMDAIKASMENGVLTVTVPKREQVKPQRIQVEISG
ncbi:OLC1v1026683C1 [Oldenlandia corymbosa var. corymbosa]|uniref:OLC1v1026683C1 n=1 Tax=Oldenlandia corymbosa var. corymbosa TaxID=529605 RepID=A0AAV1C8D7_OLDCO|nr:OLC1v1026683C1 [Oldenlandia corymbosa var. corymbosa]